MQPLQKYKLNAKIITYPIYHQVYNYDREQKYSYQNIHIVIKITSKMKSYQFTISLLAPQKPGLWFLLQEPLTGTFLQTLWTPRTIQSIQRHQSKVSSQLTYLLFFTRNEYIYARTKSKPQNEKCSPVSNIPA